MGGIFEVLIEYPEINKLVGQLLENIAKVLGENFVGLYLYGSLVWGDFDMDISDIDLMAATVKDINVDEFSSLKEVQEAVCRNNPEYDNRIEIAYISLKALHTFNTQPSQIAIVSPGEPFHTKEAGYDWLINWYNVREKGVALFGPSPTEIIDPISKNEFIQAVKAQAADWRSWIVHTQGSRPYQGHAILTLCRALYAAVTGDQVSKLQAAQWAMLRYPQWSCQIQKALEWRKDWRNMDVEPAETYPETLQFVNAIIDIIVK